MKILIVSADRTLGNGHPQNIGDAFLSDALAAALRGTGATVRIADFGDADRIGSDEVRVRLGGLAGLVGAIRGADAVIFGGGTLLADDQPTRPFAGLPRLALAVAAITRLSGKRFVIFGVGIDPVRRRRARLAIAGAIRAARVWVRDPASAVRGEQFAGVALPVCGDVSLLEAGAVRRFALPTAERAGLVLALNRREAALLTNEDVAAFHDRFGSVSFVAMDQGADADDLALTDSVRAEMTIHSRAQSWPAVLEIIGSAEAVVASRMHAMYMGVMVDTPVVAVGSAAKVVAFVDEFGVTSATSPSAAREVIGAFDPGRVDAGLDRVRSSLEEVSTWLNH
jgi:polysaccharide pyruvyl transferase WcaK-like protein